MASLTVNLSTLPRNVYISLDSGEVFGDSERQSGSGENNPLLQNSSRTRSAPFSVRALDFTCYYRRLADPR